MWEIRELNTLLCNATSVSGLCVLKRVGASTALAVMGSTQQKGLQPGLQTSRCVHVGFYGASYCPAFPAVVAHYKMHTVQPCLQLQCGQSWDGEYN